MLYEELFTYDCNLQYIFVFAAAEFVETEEQILDEPTGKHCLPLAWCSLVMFIQFMTLSSVHMV